MNSAGNMDPEYTLLDREMDLGREAFQASMNTSLLVSHLEQNTWTESAESHLYAAREMLEAYARHLKNEKEQELKLQKREQTLDDLGYTR